MSTTSETAGQKIGARIEQARNERGIKQKEFAELAQVSVRSVHSWETGETIPWKRMDEIAAILEKPKQWLLHGEAGEDTSGEVRELLARLVMNQQDLVDQVKLLRLELQGDGRIPFQSG